MFRCRRCDKEHGRSGRVAAASRRECSAKRETLHFVEKTAIRNNSADVIGKNIDPIGSTIIINAGSEQGAGIGNPVIIGDGVLLVKFHA